MPPRSKAQKVELEQAGNPEIENDEDLMLYYGEEKFSLHDLTIADRIALEEEFGEPAELLDLRFMKVVMFVIWLLKKRTDPDVKFEDLINAKVDVLFPKEADLPLEVNEDQ